MKYTLLVHLCLPSPSFCLYNNPSLITYFLPPSLPLSVTPSLTYSLTPSLPVSLPPSLTHSLTLSLPHRQRHWFTDLQRGEWSSSRCSCPSSGRGGGGGGDAATEEEKKEEKEEDEEESDDDMGFGTFQNTVEPLKC